MIDVKILFSIITIHYLADFILQTHWQASNKSKSMTALGQHVLVYTLCLSILPFFIFTNPIAEGIVWLVMNGILHLITDLITSKISSKLWSEQRWHDFFVCIGADQLLHYLSLFGTYLMLKSS